ncbi:ABC transporter substrate-binding protein [Limnohabitans sp.]|jgi:trehalose/maltose transport system substrate-binding protein|uniref:ABC transporter substrate-binding protein n=1 Tax=Limnohabitans sp. TaxID=1907725 RepID=UPI003919A99A
MRPNRPSLRWLARWTALCLGSTLATAQAVEIAITCGPSGSDVEFCLKHAQAWAAKTGHTVKNFSPPTSPTEKLALYRQLFAARSPDIDVVQIDTAWPGVLKDHLLDLKPLSRGIEAQHFPAIIANNTVGGRLVGMPWYTDAGLLYYRKDLLARHGRPVPTTWAELTETARLVQEAERRRGAANFHGFVFQAKAYEGLTCNALEWVSGHGGGSVVDAAGQITVNNAQAAQALNLAASWIGKIAPIGVLNYEEEEARGVFQNGQALFMRNWPYAWALLEKDDSPVKGKVGIAKLPGQPSAATLGGWQLGVSRYSRHPEIAADLVMYMTSAQVQKARAIGGSFNPTLPALYQDREVIAANAFMANLQEVFANSVARPTSATGLKYPQVSQSFYNAAHEVMSGRATGEEAVRRLEKRLRQIRRKHW